MKNLLSILTILLLFSCSENSTSEMEDLSQSNNMMTYIYQGEKINLEFVTNNDSLVMVNNESAKKIEKIFNENPELIELSIDDESSILFKNEEDFNNYMSSKGTPIHKNSLASRNQYWTNSNLQIYADQYFKNQIPWTDDEYITFNTVNENGRVIDEIDRLKRLHVTKYWERKHTVPYINTNYSYNGKADDNIASISVYKLAVRFYEHPDYKGKSFILDGRLNPAEIGKLQNKKRTLFTRWDNRISSIKIY